MFIIKVYEIRQYGELIETRKDFLLFGFILLFRKRILVR